MEKPEITFTVSTELAETAAEHQLGLYRQALDDTLNALVLVRGSLEHLKYVDPDRRLPQWAELEALERSCLEELDILSSRLNLSKEVATILETNDPDA